MVVVTPSDDTVKQPLLHQQPHIDAPPAYPAHNANAQAHAQPAGPSYHGGAPPHPQYVQYHTTPPAAHAYSYTHTPLPPHLIPHREPPWKRFLKAFGIALLIWFLVGLFTSSLADWGWGAVSQRWESTNPVAGDGAPLKCFVHTAGLERDGTDPQWHDSARHGVGSRSGRAELELPLSTEQALFFLTRGGTASGTVAIEDASDAHASALVTVDWDPSIKSTTASGYLFQVCELSRKDKEGGGRGLGIYMPDWSRDVGGIFAGFRVALVVKLPAGNITALSTETHNYSHDVHTSERVSFGKVELKGSNGHITVNTLHADSIELGTTNAKISGAFTVARALNLHTTNGQIQPQVVLGSTSVSTPTLNLDTTNAPITGTARLVDSTAFSAIVRTGNGKLDFAVTALPVDATLMLDATSSNSPASLVLPASFEGAVYQRTSNSGVPAFTYNVAGDPKGRGRAYQHETISADKRERKDRVFWGKDDGHIDGQVNLITTNGRAGVEIVPSW
ncbi:hypothetical protein BKA62DRAFT_644044 [Auriculariales sp. MPI-PUGE-AT-0066]|nr:hypothetical protein BKA62DRAFT_644044 [Auriculariales sp. MPI-PUGE-AT-0066]